MSYISQSFTDGRTAHDFPLTATQETLYVEMVDYLGNAESAFGDDPEVLADVLIEQIDKAERRGVIDAAIAAKLLWQFNLDDGHSRTAADFPLNDEQERLYVEMIYALEDVEISVSESIDEGLIDNNPLIICGMMSSIVNNAEYRGAIDAAIAAKLRWQFSLHSRRD